MGIKNGETILNELRKMENLVVSAMGLRSWASSVLWRAMRYTIAAIYSGHCPGNARAESILYGASKRSAGRIFSNARGRDSLPEIE